MQPFLRLTTVLCAKSLTGQDFQSKWVNFFARSSPLIHFILTNIFNTVNMCSAKSAEARLCSRYVIVLEPIPSFIEKRKEGV